MKPPGSRFGRDRGQTRTDCGRIFSFSPYFWATGPSGEAAQFGLPSVYVDASFDDIFENLEFGAMAMGEARKGPFSLLADIMYTKISGRGDARGGILAHGADLTMQTFAGLVQSARWSQHFVSF